MQLVSAGLAVTLLAFASLVACSPAQTPPDPIEACTFAYLGDKSAAAKLEIVVRGPGGKVVALHEGDAVPLVYPPQGGRVVFIGARATNLDPCGVKLSGSIRDTVNAQVRVDNRTINLQPVEGGWGASLDADIASFSNVPVCPNQWATSDLYDHVFDLTLTVADRSGHVATQTLHVTPTCAEPERAAECRCICREGYHLGESCTDDAGPADATVDATGDASTDAGSLDDGDAADVGDAE